MKYLYIPDSVWRSQMQLDIVICYLNVFSNTNTFSQIDFLSALIGIEWHNLSIWKL